jgi:hypothetical protein
MPEKWAICRLPGCKQKGARQLAKQVSKAEWSDVPVCTGCRRDCNRKLGQATQLHMNSEAEQEGGAGRALKDNMLRGFLCGVPLQRRLLPAFYWLVTAWFLFFFLACNFSV